MDTRQKSVLLRRLKKAYGEPFTQLNYSTPFQLLVAVMLSAQSTDKKVNEITPQLFKKYPDADALSQATIKTVESLIRQVNYHKTKARHLIETAKLLVQDYHGEPPRTHELLTTLPGVGNKTASVILSELKITPAMPVDTHVFRVSRRLGLASAGDRDKVATELCNEFSPSRWYELHHWLIYHGRNVCIARNPRCEECFLNDLCGAYRK
jgi:endonuclease III